MYEKIQVVFDAADPRRLGEFWALALGYTMDPIPDEFASVEDFLRSIGIPEDKLDSMWALVDPAGEGPRLYFQKVPESKTAKNRVHIDVRVAGFGVRGSEREKLVEEHVARLIEAGGAIA